MTYLGLMFRWQYLVSKTIFVGWSSWPFVIYPQFKLAVSYSCSCLGPPTVSLTYSLLWTATTKAMFYFYVPRNYNRRCSRYRPEVHLTGLRAARSTYLARSSNGTVLMKVFKLPGQSTLSSQHEMVVAELHRRHHLRRYFRAFVSDESVLVSGDLLRSTGVLKLLKELFFVRGPILRFAW